MARTFFGHAFPAIVCASLAVSSPGEGLSELWIEGKRIGDTLVPWEGVVGKTTHEAPVNRLILFPEACSLSGS